MSISCIKKPSICIAIYVIIHHNTIKPKTKNYANIKKYKNLIIPFSFTTTYSSVEYDFDKFKIAFLIILFLFQSFFGRSYNNMSSISDCKNNGECVINKKNRTACKSCRLRKCVLVGMSKSGSRYGRRSNWFKIHCLLQDQQQKQLQQSQNNYTSMPGVRPPEKTPPPPPHSNFGLNMLSSQHFPPPFLHIKTKEELMLLGLDEYKNSASPSVSSPESHNSDSSLENSDARRLPLFQGLILYLFFTPSFTHTLTLLPFLSRTATTDPTFQQQQDDAKPKHRSIQQTCLPGCDPSVSKDTHARRNRKFLTQSFANTSHSH